MQHTDFKIWATCLNKENKQIQAIIVDILSVDQFRKIQDLNLAIVILYSW